MQFDELEDSSQYFWYSPVPNLKDKWENDLKPRRDELKRANSLLAKENPHITVNNGLTKADQTQMNWVDVPVEKEKISLTRHRF